MTAAGFRKTVQILTSSHRHCMNDNYSDYVLWHKTEMMSTVITCVTALALHGLTAEWRVPLGLKSQKPRSQWLNDCWLWKPILDFKNYLLTLVYQCDTITQCNIDRSKLEVWAQANISSVGVSHHNRGFPVFSYSPKRHSLS